VSRYNLPDWAEVKDQGPMPSIDPVEAYSNGFIGASWSQEGEERLAGMVEDSGLPFAWSDVAFGSGIVGTAKEGIYLLHKEVEAVGLPIHTIAYPSQPVGNCVSRGTQNALYHTLCAAVNHGEGSLPEGMVEAAQKVNPLSSEVIYWWRSNAPRGDGWYASASLAAAKEHAGLFVRRDLTSIGGIDLRNETTATAHAYSSHSIPEKVKEAIGHNRLLTFAKCESFEEVADAIASGHAVQTDGGQGWASSVDEHGFAHQSGHWSHSMCATGVITTPAFKTKYRTVGGVLIQNSWANFNHNDSARVMGTSIALPKGSFFARWEDCSNRSWYAVNTFQGWANRKLKNWQIESLGLI
jgi:hypothetical protein